MPISCGDGGYVLPSQQGGMTILLCVVFPLEIKQLIEWARLLNVS
jgi:hypothetical protein